MERAPLRPVPSRPPGPVDPAEAARHVGAALPALEAPAARALALVALAGLPRAEAAEDVGLGLEQLADTLARARKELRRAMFPLPGSGWCQRAERLVSDRLDDALEPPGPARLEVHLRNCPRCVEHERRLAQATDSLVASFVQAHPAATEEEPAPAPSGPPLSIVVPHRPLPAARAFGVPIAPVPARPLAPVPEPAATPEPERPTPVAAASPKPEARRPTPTAQSPKPEAGQPLIWRVLLALAVALAAVTAVIAAIGIANTL